LIDTVFLACAAVGGIVFVVRTAFLFFGIGDGDVSDGSAVGDVHDAHTDADAGFRLLSLQGLTAFFMMFGLLGLALVRQSHIGPEIALAAAAGGALVCAMLIGKIFSFMSGLQSDGTMSLDKAIGQEGVVYLTIRKGDTGKVQVEVQGRLGVFDAQTSDGTEAPTGKRVRVERIAAGSVLIVSELR
jgi:membrane protein implicated in regulation of membrane protease activity